MNMILHEDLERVCTGVAWGNHVYVQVDISLFYLMDGTRGNIYIESLNDRFKNPVESIFATSETLEKLKKKVEEEVKYWNEKRFHGVLGNQTPMEFIREEMGRGSEISE